MHRNGIGMDELKKAFDTMAAQGLECVGVMSHLKSADTLSSEWFWQRTAFDALKKDALKRAKKNINGIFVFTSPIRQGRFVQANAMMIWYVLEFPYTDAWKWMFHCLNRS